MSQNNLGLVKTERVAVDKLNPAPYNPRTMTDKARQGLSNSIDSFGLLQPIIWNKQTGNVVGGHQRLSDLIGKGATETDVIVVDFSLAKEKACNVALNHSGISGQYDDDKLKELLTEIDTEDFENLNFEEFELGEMDYSSLSKEDLPTEAMKFEVRHSVIIEFDENTITEARELVKYWKERDADIGALLIEKLKCEMP
jgi:hypothetical protein